MGKYEKKKKKRKDGLCSVTKNQELNDLKI